MYISNDKEKIREFSDLRRLQLPTRLEISNFRSDVNASTSTNSISQTSGNVNPSDKRHLFFVVCFCSPVANSVHHPLRRIYHLHRVSFGFSRKISSAVDFPRSRRMRRVHKKDLSQVNHQLHESLAIVNERANGRFTTNNSISQTAGIVNSPLCKAYVNTLDRAGYGVLLSEVEKKVDIQSVCFDMKKDPAKASSRGDTFERTGSSSETFVSNNNISQTEENVNLSGKITPIVRKTIQTGSREGRIAKRI